MSHPRRTADSGAPLLERDDASAVIVDAVDAAVAGRGSVVAIEGEPGIGKSALLAHALRDVVGDAVVLAGRCDDLSIPRPLAPFVDAAGSAGLTDDDLASADALRARLRSLLAGDSLTVVAIEDAHWADVATLEILAFLARRVAGAAGLVLVTFRSSPDPASPVRRALAAAPPDGIRHLRLAPLSMEAVVSLVSRMGPSATVDAREVHAATAGNPFLVTELIRSDGAIPATVRDSVAQRLSWVDDAARQLASWLSVMPAPASWSLVEHLEPDWADAVEQLERVHLVATDDRGVGFVHDLTRRAIEDGTSHAMRRRQHRMVFDALRGIGGDPAEIAHHAAAIGEVDLLIDASIEACARAAAAGAHVEALSHVERVLPHADRLPRDDRRRLHEVASHEYSLNDRMPEALDHARRCVDASIDPDDRSEALAWLSLVEWVMGRIDDSRQHLAESVEVLGGSSPPTELLHRVATDLAHRSRWTDAWGWAIRALRQAERSGDERGLALALGAAEMVGAVVDDPVVARERGDRAIEIYRREGMQRELWIAVGNRVARDINSLRIDDCRESVAAAVALDEQLDVASYRSWLTAQRARYALYTGQWDVARALAESALATIPDGLHRATPQMVLALLEARCDGPPRDPLDEAAHLVGTSDDIQRVGNLAVAIAELAWLGADVDRSWIDHAIRLAADSGHSRYVADLAVWSRRLDGTDSPVIDRGPRALLAELAGDWRAAADEWGSMSCPYERALSLAFSDDAEAMQEAVHVVTELGARRTADRIRQMLRSKGVNLARGPRASTRRNVAGLTNRQAEVAGLLAEGLSNDEIAERLFVSPKTVDHHVSAVLAKLGVERRTDVADALADRNS